MTSSGAWAIEIPAWGWIAFGAVVVVLLGVDLLVTRGERAESTRVAFVWTVVWIAAGLGFGGLVWAAFGGRAAQEYIAAYLMEKSLSLDNLFMFLLIFESLGIRKRDQHKVLFWGILGAVVFRGIFIYVGAAALERFGWVSWIFGAILLLAAVRTFLEDPTEQTESRLVRWLSDHLPVARESSRGDFVERSDGQRVVTPLFLALVAVELTDVMFAVDSVPAALSMTHNLFLVYSSNIFAILGLRALYLFMAHTLAELRYLHYGLSALLAFAALKIVGDRWVEIPPSLSIGVIAVVIGIAVGASLWAAPSETAPS